MASNQTVVELVKFTASGADEVAAATKMIAAESNKAAESHAAFAKILADPAFRRAAEQLETARRATASLRDVESKRLDIAVRSRALRTGAYAEELRGLQNIQREQAKIVQLERAMQLRGRHANVASGGYAAELRGRAANDLAERKAERMEARARLAQQRAFVGSAAHGREVQDAAKLEREREDVARATRRAELVALHGRFGGAARAFAESPAGQAVKAGAGIGLATGAGMVRQGFNQTVEGNRLSLETRLASRELAGSFKPAIELATRAMRGFREWLEKRTPGEQNALAVGGIAATGLLAYGGAKTAMSLGSRLLGGGAAAAGSAAGNLATSAAVNAGAGAIGSVAANGAKAAGTSRLAALAKFGGRLGVAGGVLTAGYYGYQFADDIAERGFGGTAVGAAASKLKEMSKPGSNRRQVMKADAGFDEIGSAYERINNALALTDANFGENKGSKLDGFTDTAVEVALEKILEELKRQGRANEAPQFMRGG